MRLEIALIWEQDQQNKRWCIIEPPIGGKRWEARKVLITIPCHLEMRNKVSGFLVVENATEVEVTDSVATIR